MDINGVLNIILPIVFICVGVVLVIFLIELIKVVKTAGKTVEDMKAQLDPTLENVKELTTSLKPVLQNVDDITDDIKPAVAKVDPIMDRVQLTMDTVNLEMMRVDGILENVGEITQTASSATAAVDNIANAPLKAVNNVAAKVRSAFGGTTASAESEKLAEQRVAVGEALKKYQAVEDRDAKREKLNTEEEQATKKLAQDGFVEVPQKEVPPATTGRHGRVDTNAIPNLFEVETQSSDGN